MPNNPTYFALLEACGQPGCPVCWFVQQCVERYLNSLFYEHVNDSWVRRRLRRSRGFCHEHAFMVLEQGLGDALGVAMIYRDVLTTILQQLPKEVSPASFRKRFYSSWLRRGSRLLKRQLERIQRILMPQERCLACQQRDLYTQIALGVLTGSLADDALTSALASSNGLCLPHLKLAIEQITDGQALEKLLSISYEQLARLNSELAEFIRKHDYRFRDQGFGVEGDSWRRAVRATVGERGKTP